MKWKQCSTVIISVLMLAGCEKNINFNLDASVPVLVVDGEIENGKAPRVVLTKSLSYFAELSPGLLVNFFVHAADVYISNGTRTHKLKEYTVPLFGGFNAYYYSIDSADLSTAFSGELEKTYMLRIVTEGKEYHATTGIPRLASVPDSLWFKKAPMNPDSNKRVMFVRFSDPPGLGNFGRYFTKTGNAAFYPGESSVFTDEIIDGTTFDVQLQPGYDRNNPPESDSLFFNRGDTVTLKFCNIQRPVYTFWSTWEFAYQSIGNPFAQPNKVIGNVDNGALGAFCGYAAWYHTRILE